MGRGASELEELVDRGNAASGGWRVILFNCECHTFDEVERVLIAATRCTISRARALSHEVHTKGSAEVYRGPRERCEAVADVIGRVGLIVKVAE